jgi:hypothetical protein
MQDGRIVQNGTYAELVAQDGIFARLVKAGELAGPGQSELHETSEEVSESEQNKKTRKPELAGQIVH